MTEVEADGRAVLEAVGVEHQFGPLMALRNVNLRIGARERHGLIGPNGSGKSTLLKILAGALRPTRGEIRLDGRSITRWPSHRRARAGVAMKFQAPRIFPELTVAENIALAARFGAPDTRQVGDADLSRLVDFSDYLDVPAGNLSHGVRQWLELVMAMETRPRFMLLDEPTAGMSPSERTRTAEILAAAPCALLVVDHDIPLVAKMCDQITLLHEGHVEASGPTETVVADPIVARVYTREAPC